MQLMQQRVRENIEAEKAQREAEAREDAKRQARQKQLAKQMTQPRVVTEFDNGRTAPNVVKLRMLKSFMETMEQSGMSKEQIENTLKKDEREVLEEEKFL